MSYHRGLGLPPFTSTQAFAEAVDPYSWRFNPPGSAYAPYGWGPDFSIGMPMNYSHHIGYERTPIPGTRRGIGPMYDELTPVRRDLGAYDQYAPCPPVGVGEYWYVQSERFGRSPCDYWTQAEAEAEARRMRALDPRDNVYLVYVPAPVVEEYPYYGGDYYYGWPYYYGWGGGWRGHGGGRRHRHHHHHHHGGGGGGAAPRMGGPRGGARMGGGPPRRMGGGQRMGGGPPRGGGQRMGGGGGGQRMGGGGGRGGGRGMRGIGSYEADYQQLGDSGDGLGGLGGPFVVL